MGLTKKKTNTFKPLKLKLDEKTLKRENQRIDYVAEARIHQFVSLDSAKDTEKLAMSPNQHIAPLQVHSARETIQLSI